MRSLQSGTLQKPHENIPNAVTGRTTRPATLSTVSSAVTITAPPQPNFHMSLITNAPAKIFCPFPSNRHRAEPFVTVIKVIFYSFVHKSLWISRITVVLIRYGCSAALFECFSVSRDKRTQRKKTNIFHCGKSYQLEGKSVNRNLICWHCWHCWWFQNNFRMWTLTEMEMQNQKKKRWLDLTWAQRHMSPDLFHIQDGAVSRAQTQPHDSLREMKTFNYGSKRVFGEDDD